MLYLCRFKPLRHYLRGFLIAAWAGDKIAEFSFPEISFHFSLRPWFFFVSPAYAGKSPAAAYACPGTQDHPRVCGEKADAQYQLPIMQGSPPRMRGKVALSAAVCAAVRITPAYAGKSRWACSPAPNTWDYPRVCGEKLSNPPMNCSAMGSPPRMRGKGPKGARP